MSILSMYVWYCVSVSDVVFEWIGIWEEFGKQQCI
jgi:hypothetical protein